MMIRNHEFLKTILLEYGITERVLRYYISFGLIEPGAVKRGAPSLWTEKSLKRIKNIRSLSDFLKLADIKKLFDTKTDEEVEKVIQDVAGLANQVK